ncbi:MAG: alpha/beta fold hydrolase [Halanaerobiales bacterium]
MNETSSKFVDTMAMERLLTEKLSKVSHSPVNSIFKQIDININSLGKYSLDETSVKEYRTTNMNYFMLPSFFRASHYTKNDDVYLYHSSAENPEGNILLLHGLYDDNLGNYNFLIKLLNELKMNVFLMILPFHYDRKPDESLFSGEFFFSADFYRSRFAFKQALFDIENSLQFINQHNPLPTVLAGFSMGGCLVSRYYLLKKHSIDIFLINPVTNLTTLPWDNPLMITIRKDIEDSGTDINDYKSVFKELNVYENIKKPFGENTAMVYSSYDQIIREEKYQLFIKKAGIEKVNTYLAGHLNILRVPKLSRDIYNFFNKQVDFVL